MSVLNNNNNSIFVEDNIFDNNNQISKKELNSEENTRTFSISTTETLEDNEIDFNQDFFPKNKTIKFTDFLVDNWEIKITKYLTKINQQLSKI